MRKLRCPHVQHWWTFRFDFIILNFPSNSIFLSHKSLLLSLSNSPSVTLFRFQILSSLCDSTSLSTTMLTRNYLNQRAPLPLSQQVLQTFHLLYRPSTTRISTRSSRCIGNYGNFIEKIARNSTHVLSLISLLCLSHFWGSYNYFWSQSWWFNYLFQFFLKISVFLSEILIFWNGFLLIFLIVVGYEGYSYLLELL